MCLSDVPQESAAAWTDHFVNDLVPKYVACVMT